jgi:hypothetical protein
MRRQSFRLQNMRSSVVTKAIGRKPAGDRIRLYEGTEDFPRVGKDTMKVDCAGYVRSFLLHPLFFEDVSIGAIQTRTVDFSYRRDSKHLCADDGQYGEGQRRLREYRIARSSLGRKLPRRGLLWPAK